MGASGQMEQDVDTGGTRRGVVRMRQVANLYLSGGTRHRQSIAHAGTHLAPGLGQRNHGMLPDESRGTGNRHAGHQNLRYFNQPRPA